MDLPTPGLLGSLLKPVPTPGSAVKEKDNGLSQILGWVGRALENCRNELHSLGTSLW